MLKPSVQGISTRINKELNDFSWVYKVALFSFILKILYILIFTTPNQYLITDMGAYHDRALNLIRGNPRPFTNYWPPFFHIFLAAIYWPLKQFGMFEFKVQISIVIMAILGSLAIVYIYKTTRHLFGEKAARFTAILVAVWYPIIYLNIFLLSENLFIPLVYIGLYFFVFRKKYQYADLITAFFWGLAAITRPALLPFIPFVLLYLVSKKNHRFIGGFLVMFALILGLMSLYNRQMTSGTTKFISSGNAACFAMTWCEGKSIEYDSNNIRYGFAAPANSSYPESSRIYTQVPFYQEDYYYKMGFECIKDDPKVVIRNVRSIKNLFDSELFPSFYNTFGSKTLYAPFKILSIVFFCLSIITIIVQRKSKHYKDILLIASLILSIFISVYFTNPGEERYLIPYMPAVFMLASPIIVGFKYKQAWSLLKRANISSNKP